MKPGLLWSAIGGAVLLVGVGGFAWWSQARQQTEVMANAIPDQPMLADWPSAFQERLNAAEDGIRGGRKPLRSLGELSALYHANGFYNQAIHCYLALEYLDSGNATWPHRHAMILAGYGDADNALPRFETVIDLEPRYIPARLRAGDLLLKQNRFDEAEKTYQRILKVSPDEPYAILGLARCYFEQGQWEDAREKLEEVVALTSYQLGYDLIVTVYQELGMEARADEIRGRYLTFGSYQDPADPWIDVLDRDCYDVYRLSMRAGEATRNGKPEEAIRLLKRTLELAPDSTSIHFQIGMTYKDMGYTEDARGHLEYCTVSEPGFPDAWAHLSDLLAQSGQSAESDRVLKEGLVNCPGSPGLHLMYARRLEKAGAIDEAISEYETSIRLRPEEANASIELANLYFKLDRIDDGVNQLRLALQAEPDNPVALSTQAQGAIMAGNQMEARQWMNRIAQQPRVTADQVQRLRQAYAEAFGERLN